MGRVSKIVLKENLLYCEIGEFVYFTNIKSQAQYFRQYWLQSGDFLSNTTWYTYKTDINSTKILLNKFKCV